MEVAQSPLPDAATSQSRGGRIFVQIPADRDSELSAMVRDLVKKAYDPASLRIAVLWQKGPDEEFDPESARGAELEVVEISHADSQGCNWARCEIQKRWRGEPFTLILDSHHRFARAGIKSCVGRMTHSSARASRSRSSPHICRPTTP